MVEFASIPGLSVVKVADSRGTTEIVIATLPDWFPANSEFTLSEVVPGEGPAVKRIEAPVVELRPPTPLLSDQSNPRLVLHNGPEQFVDTEKTWLPPTTNKPAVGLIATVSWVTVIETAASTE
jgi:hypothetical protein